MNWTATTVRPTWLTTGKTAGVAMLPRKLDRRETASGAVHATSWTATTACPTLLTTGKIAGVAMLPRRLDRRETADGAVHAKNWTATTARPMLLTTGKTAGVAMLPRKLIDVRPLTARYTREELDGDNCTPDLVDDREDRWCSDASTETDRRETADGAVHAMNWAATTARPTLLTTGKTAGVAMPPRKLTDVRPLTARYTQ